MALESEIKYLNGLKLQGKLLLLSNFDVIILLVNPMPENKPFTQEEDQIIKHLYEEQKITKWAIIARKLTEEYSMPRNAKQCRDRYQQFLDPLVLSVWTLEEELKLFKLHDKIGNKWAVIAHQFPGKTDNIVKNHFYSKLRKSVRRLNKIIQKNFKKEFKELNIKMIYKIIEGFEEQFKENPIVEQELSEYCMDIKNELLEYSNENQNEEMMDEDFSRQKILLSKIFNFNKSYKRKSKKQKRNSIQVSQLFKTPERKWKGISDMEESQSSFSFPISHQPHQEESSSEEANSNKSPRLLVVVEEDEIRQSQNSFVEVKLGKNQRQQLMSSGKISQEKPINVEDMLRGSGALEMGKFPHMIYKAQASHKSFSNRSEYEKIDMFDQIRFSGGSKNMYMQEPHADDLRFSGGLRMSGGLRRSNQIEEERQMEDLHRSHR